MDREHMKKIFEDEKIHYECNICRTVVPELADIMIPVHDGEKFIFQQAKSCGNCKIVIDKCVQQGLKSIGDIVCDIVKEGGVKNGKGSDKRNT